MNGECLVTPMRPHDCSPLIEINVASMHVHVDHARAAWLNFNLSTCSGFLGQI